MYRRLPWAANNSNAKLISRVPWAANDSNGALPERARYLNVELSKP